MKPEDLIGDQIGEFLLQDFIRKEEKKINGLRGSYQTLTYLSSLPDNTPVWVTLFQKNGNSVGGWRTILPDYDGNERLEKRMKDYRFLQAAQLSSFFPENSIVPKVHGLGEDEIIFTKELDYQQFEFSKNLFIYLVTEPLEEINPILTDKQTADLGIKLARGLQGLHDQGTYHIKINPHNIVGSIKNPKLINFNDQSGELGNTVLTAYDGSKGQTVELLCIPFETIENDEIPRNPQVDIYGLAQSLYFFNQGFPEKIGVAKIVREKDQKPRYPELIWSPGTSPILMDTIHKATEKQPKKRYWSVTEFAQALQKV